MSVLSFTLNISRTKTDDPEREKLKAKAKEIQRDEAERIRYLALFSLFCFLIRFSFSDTRRPTEPL